jgi:peptidyl-prolyl cis-trans isomerase A (cyclophilin A)
VEHFPAMKIINLMCALGVFIGAVTVKADDTKSAAPAFADPSKLTEKAPDSFKTVFSTTKGNFTIEVTRALSPNGADRFYNLAKSGYFKDIAFFRVVPGFMVQFGIHGDPAISAKWEGANIQDDPVKGSNTRGTITYAMSSAPNSRSTQFFINFGDNSRLDGMGFAPFGKVTDGMDVVDKIYGGYGDMPEQGGNGPDPGGIASQGNDYLKKNFPKIDYIKSVTVVTEKK